MVKRKILVIVGVLSAFMVACQSVDDIDVSAESESIIVADSNELDLDEIIVYNGKEYNKEELCNQTLEWLKLTEEERMFSSYLPPEFLFIEEKWGVTLSVENVTPTSLTIVCNQSGGEAVADLDTGSWYILEQWTQKDGWKEVQWKPQEYDVGWTSEAWIIPKNDSVKWNVEWEWLYGELTSGKYRIGKEITNFKGTGDYEKAVYYAEFEIK